MVAFAAIPVVGSLALLAPFVDEPRDAGAAAKKVLFGRDVRPILANHCFACHGPDEGRRKAGLRLDVFDGATAELRTGNHALVPGSLDESELVARVTHESVKQRMPPQSTGKPLSPAQIETLKSWVEQGGKYERHWSLVPPTRAPGGSIDGFLLARLHEEGLEPSPPAPLETQLRRVTFDLTGLPPTPDEIDAFLADAKSDGEQGDAAYRRAVKRLLASPRYGEQMARYWLDLARYGDTHGYHLDNERSLWRWREWVIDAFNTNEPFDRFTVEQLAGDLLPDATDAQKIATGFDRCNPTTGEGGLIEEEYLVKYVVDRVNTTSTLWLGLTVGCAQCHDHKFDPITQRDYYSMFAFFNSIAERGTDENALAPAPAMKAPTPEQAAALASVRAKLDAERSQLDAPMADVDAAQEQWEREWAARLAGRWRVLDVASARSSGGATLTERDDHSVLVSAGASGSLPATDVHEFTFAGAPPTITALRLEALADDALPMKGPGTYGNGNFVLTNVEAEVVGAVVRKVEFASAVADHAQDSFPIANAIDGDAGTGWAILPQLTSHQAILVPKAPIVVGEGESLRVRLHYESQFAQHLIGRPRFAATSDAGLAPATLAPWHVLGPFTAASGKLAYTTPFEPEATLNSGVDLEAANWVEKPEWTDGKVWNLAGERTAYYLARTIDAPTDRSASFAFGSDDAIKVWWNGEVVLDRDVERSVAPDQDKVTVELKAGANLLVMKVVNYAGGFAFVFRETGDEPDGVPLPLAESLGTPKESRTAAQQKSLRDHFRARRSPPWKELRSRVDALEREVAELDAQVPPTMVAAELAQPRTTTMLIRGQYDKKGDVVEPAIPAALGRLPDGAQHNRLGLAQWLVSRDNPLTARVAVNRLWAQLFGVGIVKTAQDFGAQGEWPVHQELLDWLAVEFVESGWDVKHLVELIVTSQAYRQSSNVTPELLAKDRDNRLLARGPRFRLDAEEIRDLALAASGLLVERIGGRSVKPYQPGDLWKVVGYPTSNTSSFVQDHGEALWRRSLYTFWKRTSPPANLVTFDAPSRESCTVQRARTNTPLQALVTMNDEQFVEAARVLAQRLIREVPAKGDGTSGSATDGGAVDAARITLAYRLLVGRRPTERELAICAKAVERELAHYRGDAAAASALVHHGEAPLPEGLDGANARADDVAQLAAWTTLASTLLNLDETVTKG
jgi:hypothetical protein